MTSLKRLGETLCVNFHHQFGTPVRIVRPFNVYGPGQRLDDQRIVPDLISAALRGGPIVLFSDGRPTRSFCYARDFVGASLQILVAGNDADPYNVGNDQEVSILEAAQTMARIATECGRPVEVEFRLSSDPQYLTDNPTRRCPDLSKLSNQFGYVPEFDLAAGLTRTFQHYLQTEGVQSAA